MHDQQRNLFRHLLRPARGGAAGVIVVFAFMYSIALKAGLIGLPMALILTSWFFKYAYVLFDHTTRGFDDPPALDIQMLNPLDEQRPLGQVVILGLIFLIVKLAAAYVSLGAAFALGLGCAICLPASVAVLGLECNVLHAANPIEWLRIIKGLGLLYPLILALILSYIALLGLIGKFEPWFALSMGLAMFAVLSVFSFLGGALFERRLELGLETYHSPERTEELQRIEAVRESERVVTEAYGQLRAGSHVKCWAVLQEWLTRQGSHPEDYRWLCEHVLNWEDSRYITRLSEDYVDRLLALKRNGEAVDLVAQRLLADQHFRPKSAAATLSIAQLAARGGGMPRVARALLADFGTRFEGDPRVGAANLLARQLGGGGP